MRGVRNTYFQVIIPRLSLGRVFSFAFELKSKRPASGSCSERRLKPKKRRRFFRRVLTRLLEVCVPFGEVLEPCELGYFQLTDRVLRLPRVFHKETGLLSSARRTITGGWADRSSRSPKVTQTQEWVRRPVSLGEALQCTHRP